MATTDYTAQLLELLKQNPSLAGAGGDGWYFDSPTIRRPGDFQQSLGDTGDLYATDYSLQGLEGLKGGATIDPRTGMVTIGGQTMSADDFANRYRTAAYETTGETGLGATDWQNYLVDTQNGSIAGQEHYDTPGFSWMKDFILPAAAIWGGGALLGSALGGAGAGAAGGLGETAALGMDQVGALSGLGEAGAAGEAAAGLGGGGLGAGGASLVPEAMAGWGAGLPEMLTTTGMGSQVAGGLGSWGAAGSALGAGLGGATLGSFVAPSMWDSLKNLIPNGLPESLVPQGTSEFLKTIGSGLSTVAPILGGLLGASEAGKPNTATSQSKTDPRLDQYLYGSGYGDQNSLLGAAQSLWQQNKSGMNPTMQVGLDMQRSALMDPAYGQSYQNMRTTGMGLLNTPVAGNPFTQGQGNPTLQPGGQGGLLDVSNPAHRMKALTVPRMGLLGG